MKSCSLKSSRAASTKDSNIHVYLIYIYIIYILLNVNINTYTYLNETYDELGYKLQ